MDTDYLIPCGKCVGCRSTQRRDWGLRIYHESLSHDRNCMVTLTYNDEHIPQDGKLSKSDVQKFIKRARKEFPMRYFAAGEYGEKTHRPHYHICIFGEDFRAISHSIGNGMYTNDQLERLWSDDDGPIGQVSAIPLEPSSCMYVAGYVTKKAGDMETFSLMSKKPPLAYEFIMDHKEKLGNTAHFKLEGRTYPVPKVYTNWVNSFDTAKAKHQPIESSLEELRNQETNHKARLNLLQEKI